MRTRRESLVAVLATSAMVVVLGALASCDKNHNSAAIEPGTGEPRPLVIGPGSAAALGPASLAIHPLTRIGADANGKPAILLHLEIRDASGQNIKALGRMRAELYRPSGGASSGQTDATGAVWIVDPAANGAGAHAGAQSQDRVWDLDLRDPDRNALMNDDLVTRTYTIPLGGLPEWLIEWSNGGGNAAPTLIVSFAFADGSGEKTLRAGARLTR